MLRRRICLFLLIGGIMLAQTPVGTVNRPSYLRNVHSSNLMWQTRATTFTGASVTKTGTVVHWDFGDGTTANSNAPTKVYPNTALKTFYMVARDGWSGLTVLDLTTRSLQGRIPPISRLTALGTFHVYTNQLTGSIPSLTTNAALVSFHLGSNQLTGSIPSLATNTALAYFHVGSNQLTGSIPSLTTNTALAYFQVYANQLTGSIPSLTTNTALVHLDFDYNQLTGSIPSLTTNTALVTLYVYANQLTGWTGGLGTRVLTIFNASTNALTEVAVNAILADLVVAQAGGNPVCDVNLSGGTNAAPTGQGLTDKATLVAAGWTVATN